MVGETMSLFFFLGYLVGLKSVYKGFSWAWWAKYILTSQWQKKKKNLMNLNLLYTFGFVKGLMDDVVIHNEACCSTLMINELFQTVLHTKFKLHNFQERIHYYIWFLVVKSSQSITIWCLCLITPRRILLQ